MYPRIKNSLSAIISLSFKKSLSAICVSVSLLASCAGHPNVPSSYDKEDRLPEIFPDYTFVTIPANIAPLNFEVQEKGDECVARLTAGETQYTYGEDLQVRIQPHEWKQLLEKAAGNDIKVEVFVRNGQNWKAYKPFSLEVAKDSTDPYISYRLIYPSYIAYEQLTINQRSLSSFDESIIYNNEMVSTEGAGQCVNCHSYRNGHTSDFQLHLRQAHGGTIICLDNELKKVNLKTDSTLSAGVYPAWHPTEDLIAYSTNLTGQSFHSRDKAKIEVQDSESDLILYDIRSNTVSTISNLKDELEIFPVWSPDGKYLYFCSAHFDYVDSIPKDRQLLLAYKKVRYSLYRKSFDIRSHTFGSSELIYDAAANKHSVTLPRISPDGRYIVFAEGDFGCFHVWHPHADIHCLDLTTGEIKTLDAMNSPESESYPSFSSNGRWILFASRRDDGNHTRPYIAYFDSEGNAHKPFELPQEDPSFYSYFTKSYNRPEFMVEPVMITPQQLARIGKQPATPAEYISNPPSFSESCDAVKHVLTD